MAIHQHRKRPQTPSDQAEIDSFFGQIKGDWPHLDGMEGPAVLDAELARVRGEYSPVRLHAGIGCVTPSDGHHGRGHAIRCARRIGLNTHGATGSSSRRPLRERSARRSLKQWRLPSSTSSPDHCSTPRGEWAQRSATS